MKYLFFVFFLTLSIEGLTQTKESKLLKEGRDLFREKKYKDALAKFQKELKNNESCDIFLWIADCYVKLEQITNAKSQFLLVLSKSCSDRENNESMINLGNCYRFSNQVDSALYYYNMAIEMYPELAADAYFNKAQLLYISAHFNEAKENYDKAILLNSSNWIYYMKRQEISFILKNFSDAIQDMLKAKELNGDVDITFNMAYAYSMMGHFKQADSIYQIIYDENDALFLNNYGFNKYKLGSSLEGIELIRKALLIDPTNSYAYRNLAYIAIDQNDQTKTCEYLNKAKELDFARHYGTEVDELLKNHCK